MATVAELYEKVVQTSQENVSRLNEMLGELDRFVADMAQAKASIKEIPAEFQSRLTDIIALTEKHLKDVSLTVDRYLTTSDKTLGDHLQNLMSETDKLRQEIDRSATVDFGPMFKALQEDFIIQARQDIGRELIKFENAASRLQHKINELETHVNRLSEIDLEKHFNTLQSTLAALSGSVAQINLNLNTIASSLADISAKQTNLQKEIGELKSKIDQEKPEQEKRHTELLAELDKIAEDVHTQITNTQQHLTNGFSSVNENINESTDKVIASVKSHIDAKVSDAVNRLEHENELLRKDIKTNRIIQIVAALACIGLLIYLISKSGV